MTFRSGLTAAAVLSLSACGAPTATGTAGSPAPAGGGTPQNACITAVNTNMAGGTSSVVSSEPSGAGTVVILRSRDGTNWRCQTSGNAVVAELSII